MHLPNPPLAILQKACEAALSPLGYPPEARAWSPHLTLGRVKDFHAGNRIVEAIERLRARAFAPLVQAATEVTLFQSMLHPKGAQYVVAHKVRLGQQ